MWILLPCGIPPVQMQIRKQESIRGCHNGRRADLLMVNISTNEIRAILKENTVTVPKSQIWLPRGMRHYLPFVLQNFARIVGNLSQPWGEGGGCNLTGASETHPSLQFSQCESPKTPAPQQLCDARRKRNCNFSKRRSCSFTGWQHGTLRNADVTVPAQVFCACFEF